VPDDRAPVSPRSSRGCSPVTTAPRTTLPPAIIASTWPTGVVVFYFYLFYLWDDGYGPGSMKVCTYFRYAIKVNGPARAKRRAAAAGMPRPAPSTLSPS
jgi:hypothetical protein